MYFRAMTVILGFTFSCSLVTGSYRTVPTGIQEHWQVGQSPTVPIGTQIAPQAGQYLSGMCGLFGSDIFAIRQVKQ